MLKAGFVGLPNVGKSTLFNAVTRTRKAEAANYPFCTIDPNVGVVTVPDERLAVLSKISGSKKLIPTAIEFVDIAGLVAGASKGEGLGNKFLANIRETHAIAHVVRCFDDSDVLHVAGHVDPLRDIGVINTELVLADIETLDRALRRAEKQARTTRKEDVAHRDLLIRMSEHLNQERPARAFAYQDTEREALKELCLLTDKPVMYVANVDEAGLTDESEYIAAIDKIGKAYLELGIFP